jgi:hypothetical protein
MLQDVEEVTSQVLPYMSEAVAEKVADNPAVSDEPAGETKTLATAT